MSFSGPGKLELFHTCSPAGFRGSHRLSATSQQWRFPPWDTLIAPLQVRLDLCESQKEMELCFRGRGKGKTFLGYPAASGPNSTVQAKGVNDSGFLMLFLPLAPISFQITAPVPPPRPSPTLSTALWGSCQGPVSGFLHTASNRAGEAASWRSSLPSTFLPLLSSFLP